MPTSTKCFCIIGFAGLMASAGCTSTTAVNQSASLAPVEAGSPLQSPSEAGLPDTMEIASVDRDAAAADGAQQGTVITAVAYASPAPDTGSVVALNNAMTQPEQAQDATPQQAIAAVAPGQTAGEQQVATAAETSQAPASGAQTVSSGAATTASSSADAAASSTEAPVVLASLAPSTGKPVAARSSELDRLIERYAHLYEVPVALVRRVVKRESTFNPAARNGPYLGLMQIRHDTARGMGYQGNAQGLLNAETNLTYAVKYLKGAYVTASGDHDKAVRFYSRGYYYDAKKRGLLVEAGLKPGKPAAKVQTIAAEAGEQKARELDRGARIVAASNLPGVASSSRVSAPAPARMGGSLPETGSASLAIAE